MPVNVSVALHGITTPQPTQIVVTGMTPGEKYSIAYRWSGGQRAIRAGSGIADATGAVIRGDIYAPPNTSVTYEVSIGSRMYSSAPVTIAHHEDYAFHSISGRVTVTPNWQNNGVPRTPEPRVVAHAPKRRSTLITISDVPLPGEETIVVRTQGEQTRRMEYLLSTGEVIVIRTNGRVADLPQLRFAQPIAFPQRLVGETVNRPTREWEITYLIVGEPEPDTPIAASVIDDLTASYAGQTIVDMGAEWAGKVIDDVTRYDWKTRAGRG